MLSITILILTTTTLFVPPFKHSIKTQHTCDIYRQPCWYVHAYHLLFHSSITFSLYFLLHHTNSLLLLADSFFATSTHMARLKTTVQLVSPSNSHFTSPVQSLSQEKSTASGSNRKCLIDNMDILALHKQIPDHIDDQLMNNEGPIAVRDWLAGCIPPPNAVKGHTSQ